MVTSYGETTPGPLIAPVDFEMRGEVHGYFPFEVVGSTPIFRLAAEVAQRLERKTTAPGTLIPAVDLIGVSQVLESFPLSADLWFEWR